MRAMGKSNPRSMTVTFRPSWGPRVTETLFGAPPDSVLVWRGVSFVGCEKRVLRRLFREKEISLTPKAQTRFDALPEQFTDFIATPERFTVQWAEAA